MIDIDQGSAMVATRPLMVAVRRGDGILNCEHFGILCIEKNFSAGKSIDRYCDRKFEFEANMALMNGI